MIVKGRLLSTPLFNLHQYDAQGTWADDSRSNGRFPSAKLRLNAGKNGSQRLSHHRMNVLLEPVLYDVIQKRLQDANYQESELGAE